MTALGGTYRVSASVGSYTNIPSSAMGGTFMGNVSIVRPAYKDKTLAGVPAGAFGMAKVVIESPIMTASGFNFWNSLFGTSTSSRFNDNVEIWITVQTQINYYSPGEMVSDPVTGWLHRPTYDYCRIGTNDKNTLYYGVKIEITGVDAG